MERREPVQHPVLRAAVSSLSATLLAGAARPAIVLGAHRFGVYLDVGGSVLPLLARDAVPLPTSVRVTGRAAELSWGVVAGDTVEVGAGVIRLPRLDVRAVRTWRPARVRVVATEAPSPPPPATVSLRDEDAVRRGVIALLGRGPGLTPAGDDALAGALLVGHALGLSAPLADEVRRHLGRTTAVSAALLEGACEGYAAAPVVALVDAAVAGDAAAVRATLPPVLAIGHTSGSDLVAGVAAALGAFDGPRRSARARTLRRVA